jgi:integrase
LEVFVATIRQRVCAGGAQRYHVQVRIKGFPPATGTFDRKSDAKRWALETELAIRRGTYFVESAPQKPTLHDAILKYRERVLPLIPKQRRDLNSHLIMWDHRLGQYHLSALTHVIIEDELNKMAAEMTVRGRTPAPATILRKQASLAAVLKIAALKWGWLPASPMSRVGRRKVSNQIVRYLDEAELPRLMHACQLSPQPLLYPMVVLAISTGMRLGEIQSLRWVDVHIPDSEGIGSARLKMTKNGECRNVPIAGTALQVMRNLREIQAEKSGLIFGGSRPLKSRKALGRSEVPIEIRRPWKSALATARVENFRFHDLRHCAASYLAMSGASHLEIAAVLGHKTLEMVKRYAHLSPSHTAGIVERMNARYLTVP